MSFERYVQIYNGGNTGTTLRPGGKSESFSFDLKAKNDAHYRLFTVGETNMFYQWKDEPDYPQYYRMYTGQWEEKRQDEFFRSLKEKRENA